MKFQRDHAALSRLQADLARLAQPFLPRRLGESASLTEPDDLQSLFDANPSRAAQLSYEFGPLFLDLSKNLITADALSSLHQLAEASGMSGAIAALFSGAQINNTEGRAALHTALRSAAEQDSADSDRSASVAAAQSRMQELCSAVHSGDWLGYDGHRISHVVNLGIGGSDLGPAMAVRALADFAVDSLHVSFVSNVDPAHLARTLQGLDPATTLFIVASKTFTTQETLANARAAKRWLLAAGAGHKDIARHFIATTANAAAAQEFGIAQANVLPLWDWVGGRFSLWSVIGLPIALAIGFDNFQTMLRGAGDMDTHFATAKAEDNLPLNLALLSYWYRQFFDSASTAVVPYSEDLSLFPSYLQQLYMESLGKSVSREGAPLNLRTSEVIWGSAGTNGQHSYFQQLHQGTELIPVEFIALASPSTTRLAQGQGQGESENENEKGSERDSGAEQQAMLLANCLSQSWALMRGDDGAGDPHRNIPGHRPSTTMLLDSLTPASLGMLIALYEHRVFALSVLWNINAFDQWGVELGKRLAQQVLTALESQPSSAALDPSTAQLIARIRASRAGKK